jgi:hypothetical protein
MKRDTSSTQPDARQAGRTIPDQARDCGPQVDTWPILDTQAAETPKPATGKATTRPRPDQRAG